MYPTRCGWWESFLWGFYGIANTKRQPVFFKRTQSITHAPLAAVLAVSGGDDERAVKHTTEERNKTLNGITYHGGQKLTDRLTD